MSPRGIESEMEASSHTEHKALTVVICADHATINGGQAKVAVDSAVGLKRAGHRVIFFAASGPAAPQLAEAGVEVIDLGQADLLGHTSRISAAMQGIWNQQSADVLEKLLAGLPRENVVVHVHGWAKALSPSIAKPLKASGLPVAYSIHDYFLFCPNGGFYNFQQAHSCQLTPLSVACWATHCDSRKYAHKVWRNARLLFARHYAHLQDCFSDIILLSPFQKEIVAPYLPKQAAVHILGNPIEADDLGPKQNPASGEMIFVGRLSREKGALLFAEAAREVGITPVFIGDGPVAEELKTAFPAAKFLGWQGPQAVRDAMRTARAQVFPSLWYEGQPLTVQEAKAMGTPVIVSDGCAGREDVEDGVTGLWFRNGDAADLARALRVVQDDRFIIAASAASYAAYWSDPPTLERHIERLVAVYEGMLARKSAAIRPLVQSSIAPHLAG